MSVHFIKAPCNQKITEPTLPYNYEMTIDDFNISVVDYERLVEFPLDTCSP